MTKAFPLLRLPVEIQVQILKHYFPKAFSVDMYRSDAIWSNEKKHRIEAAGSANEISLLWTSKLLAAVSKEALISRFTGVLRCDVYVRCFSTYVSTLRQHNMPFECIKMLDLMIIDNYPNDLPLFLKHYYDWTMPNFISRETFPALEVVTVRITIGAQKQRFVTSATMENDFKDGLLDWKLCKWLKARFIRKGSGSWLFDNYSDGERLTTRFVINSRLVIVKAYTSNYDDDDSDSGDYVHFRAAFRAEHNGELTAETKDWIFEVGTGCHSFHSNIFAAYDETWQDKDGTTKIDWHQDD